MNLHEELSLATAARYANPGTPGDILPLVLGDFVSEDVITAADDIGGATPAVLIDRNNLVYLINDAPSDPTTTPLVYFNGVLQESSVFTYHPGQDYESTGHFVATITFTLGAVLGGEVSVRMRGAVDSNLELITNPITAIQHVFTTYGNWVSTDFDAVSCNEARDIATALGYTIHWAFTDTREYAQHLADILFHYHGKSTTNQASQLVINLLQDAFVPSEQILDHLESPRDIDAEDPDDAVEWDLDLRNVINELHFSYQYSWATNEYARKDVVRTAPASVSFYRVRKGEKRLPGIRSEHHLNMWASIFLNRFALFPAIVRFPLLTASRIGLLPSTYTTFSWAWGPGAHGEGWSERILEVLNSTIRLRAHEQPLECYDTGLTFLRPTYLVLLDQEGGTWYLRALTYGALELTSFIPAEVAMLSAPQHWIERQSQDDTTWYIYPTPDGTLEVDTTEPAVGSGTTESLTFVDRRSHAWAIQAMNTGAVQVTDLI